MKQQWINGLALYKDQGESQEDGSSDPKKCYTEKMKTQKIFNDQYCIFPWKNQFQLQARLMIQSII